MPREKRLISRSALVAALEDLRAVGIDARAAVATDRQAAANRILLDIFSEYPHAIGSWAAWTEPDECAFEDEVLTAPLTIHCSAEDVVRATLAIFIERGIVTEAIEHPDGPRVVVRPDRQLADSACRASAPISRAIPRPHRCSPHSDCPDALGRVPAADTSDKGL
jgi:hypothetical protein